MVVGVEGLTVSKLASRVGTSADALRYYERIGLLPRPDRSPSGYRLYGTDAEERVRFIKRAQRFGLRLEDIAGLIAVRDRGSCPCGGTRRLLEARLAQLDDEMASLHRLRQDIRTMLDESDPGIDGEASACGPGCGTGLLQIRPTGPAPSRIPIHPTAQEDCEP